MKYCSLNNVQSDSEEVASAPLNQSSLTVKFSKEQIRKGNEVGLVLLEKCKRYEKDKTLWQLVGEGEFCYKTLILCHTF